MSKQAEWYIEKALREDTFTQNSDEDTIIKWVTRVLESPTDYPNVLIASLELAVKDTW